MSFPDEDDLPEDYGHLAEYGGINKNNKRQSSLSEQAQWEKIADIRKTTQDLSLIHISEPTRPY